MLSNRDKFGVALMVLIGVIVVFVAPLVDLEPTALRAARSAQLLALAMIAAAMTFASFVIAVRSSDFCESFPTETFLPNVDVVDLDCARLC